MKKKDAVQIRFALRVPESFVKLEKVMLVSAQECDAVEECLVGAKCTVAKVDGGPAALSRAQRENFDAAVLVSTGKKMDLAETAFNLRDLRSAMPILIVTGVDEPGQSAVPRAVVAESVPNARVFSLEELRNSLGSRKNSFKRTKRKRFLGAAKKGRQP
jgi:CheY-like chemotaxis protein